MRRLPSTVGRVFVGLVATGLVVLPAANPALLGQDAAPEAVPEAPPDPSHETDEGDPVRRWECPMPVYGARGDAVLLRRLPLAPGRRWRHPDSRPWLDSLPLVRPLPGLDDSPGLESPRSPGAPYRLRELAVPEEAVKLRNDRMPVLPLDCFNPLLLKPEPPVFDGPEPDEPR